MRPIQANISYPKKGRKDIIEKAFVEVTLGRPSAKCKHLGVCKIERVYSNSFDRKKTNLCVSSDTIYALANFREGEYFELVFERNSISNDTYKYHFQTGVFIVEEKYTKDLGLGKTSIVISKGEYNIQLSDTLLTIRFDID